MSTNYPSSLDSFVAKSDGPDHLIFAAHINDPQDSIVAIETELGTIPSGSLTDLKSRLAVRLNDNGKLKQPQQLVTVGITNCDYTTITAALNSISDSALNKIYTILVFPGEYDEAIALKNYVNIVAIDSKSTKILQQVSDNNVECHCYLKITIKSHSGYGLYTQHANSFITVDGDISSSANRGAYCVNGTQTINGNVSSSIATGSYCTGGIQRINGNVSSTSAPSGQVGVYCLGGTQFINGNIFSANDEAVYISTGYLNIKNSTIKSDYNSVYGNGVEINGGTIILQNVKIICLHSDAKSFFSNSGSDVYCMSVWCNRNDGSNITQKITNGFIYDIDVLD